VEARLGELFEAELVPPDAERRLDIVDDDADVADALEHDPSLPEVGARPRALSQRRGRGGSPPARRRPRRLAQAPAPPGHTAGGGAFTAANRPGASRRTVPPKS